MERRKISPSKIKNEVIKIMDNLKPGEIEIFEEELFKKLPENLPSENIRFDDEISNLLPVSDITVDDVELDEKSSDCDFDFDEIFNELNKTENFYKINKILESYN